MVPRVQKLENIIHGSEVDNESSDIRISNNFSYDTTAMLIIILENVYQHEMIQMTSLVYLALKCEWQHSSSEHIIKFDVSEFF